MTGPSLRRMTALGCLALAGCASRRLPPGTPPPEYETRSVPAWPATAAPAASGAETGPDSTPRAPSDASGPLDAGAAPPAGPSPPPRVSRLARGVERIEHDSRAGRARQGCESVGSRCARSSQEGQGPRRRRRAACARSADIQRENELDLAAGRTAGLASAMLDRLRMDGKGVEATARAVEHVMTLPDPVASRGPMQRMPSGIQVGRQRLPLGVVAIIYESRPNVTVDAAALCLKSGNASLLRGGKEAAHTNRILGPSSPKRSAVWREPGRGADCAAR